MVILVTYLFRLESKLLFKILNIKLKLKLIQNLIWSDRNLDHRNQVNRAVKIRNLKDDAKDEDEESRIDTQQKTDGNLNFYINDF